MITPSTPSAPNTQNVAIGYLIADAMSKSNNANQKQLMSQKEIDQQLMEQNISSAITQIIENAPDHPTALAQIKNFLNLMNANDASWGSEIQGWITQELKRANSYTPPQDLVDQLNDDMKVVTEQTANVQNDENTLNSDIATRDACQDRLNAYKKALDDAPWWKKTYYAAIIAGLGVALGYDDAAIFFAQTNLDNAKDALKGDEANIPILEQKIKNDPNLTSHLSWLSSSDNLLQQEASEGITNYKATVNALEGFNKSMEGLIEEFTSNAGVSVH